MAAVRRGLSGCDLRAGPNRVHDVEPARFVVKADKDRPHGRHLPASQSERVRVLRFNPRHDDA